MTAKGFAVLTVVVVAAAAIGCGPDFGNRGDRDQVKKQQALSDQANQQVGLPGVTNFTERKLVRKLYELRDQNVSTFTYVVDFQGRLWHLCDSLGYGLPYGVQFTNPERPAWAFETQEQGNITLPPSRAERTVYALIRGGDMGHLHRERCRGLSARLLGTSGDRKPLPAQVCRGLSPRVTSGRAGAQLQNNA